MAPTNSQGTSRSRVICHHYFLHSGGQTWQCKKCDNVKRKNGGWTNLINHLKSCIGENYEAQFDHIQKTKANGGMLRAFFGTGDKEREMFEWIELLVMKNLPFTFVDCPYVRKLSKNRAVSSKTLRKYVFAVMSIVQEKIKQMLPSKFVIMFDGWTEGSEHYIGLTASYISLPACDDDDKDTTAGHEVITQALLSMRPLLVDEVEGMTAKDHLIHLSKVLGTYGKVKEDVLCMIGDNCSVNRSMSRIMDVPLLGCGSHKFNLAVRRWITLQPQLTNVINKVSLVMKKASTLKIASKLRKLTAYSTVRDNDTRWSSTFQMISRFFKIQAHLNVLVELLELLPTHLEIDILFKAHRSLTKFDQITVLLQPERWDYLCRGSQHLRCRT